MSEQHPLGGESTEPDGGLKFHFQSESHLRSILATVPDAMAVIDEGGHILSFSAAAEKMFGYAEREVLGENVSMLMPSPDRERHDSYLETTAAQGSGRSSGSAGCSPRATATATPSR